MLLAGFGSRVVPDAVAMLVALVPPALGLAFTTIVNTAMAPDASIGVVAVTAPVTPTAGVVVVKPPGAVIDTKVVLGGRGSPTTSAWTAAGPAFVTVMV